jgi:hypothetical protein
MATLPLGDGDGRDTIGLIKRWISHEIESTDNSGGLISRAQQAGTIISVVVIGIISLIGLLIFGEVFSALPLNDDVFASGGALEGIPSNIVSGFGDALGLVPVILLILLASVVIGVVQNMRMSA